MSEEQKDKLPGDGALRSPLLTKLENFWYYHKWHFLAGLLALVVLVVTLVQCNRNGRGNDAYLMYAGGYTLAANVRAPLEASVALFAEDSNGDGKLVVSVNSYAIYTDKELVEKFPDPSNRASAKQFSYNNKESFEQELLAGEATVCFLSPSLFAEVAESGALRPLSEYYTLPEGVAGVAHGGTACGVRLFDLPLATYPGFSSLPKDTILCVRNGGSLVNLFGDKREAEALYEANMRLVARMLSASAYAAE